MTRPTTHAMPPRRFRSQLGAAFAVAALATMTACTPSPSPSDVAQIQVAIREAPDDAGCLRLTATGAQTLVRTFGLKPGQSTIFTLGGLPTGSTVFAAEAFEKACDAAEFSSPNYVSDAVTTVLQPGMNGPLTLFMHKRAQVRVDVDFPGDERGVWVSATNAPPGTPALAKLDLASSSETHSFFDVFVEGYFLQERVAPNGDRYTRLTVPGLGATGQVGAPDLPALRLELAVPSDAQAVAVTVTPLAVVVQGGFNPWPQPEPAFDDELGTPEKFVRDDKIYGGRDPFPPAGGRAARPSSKLSSIRGTTVEVFPALWEPANGKLTVATKLRVEIEHRGSFVDEPMITRERDQVAAVKFANWAIISRCIKPDLFRYAGDFLFIHPPGYEDELAPLVDQKKGRGYAVTEMTTTETGHTCAGVRGAIEGWYASKPAWRDKFALLVGDVGEIALCTAPTGDPSDDLYADADGDGIDDLDEEVYLGRLSVDSEADAATQVAKILRYEDAPDLFFDYGSALLVAHREEAPGKYVGAHESVRTAVYANPPAFSTLYGHLAGVTDSDVSDAINTGIGLVAYRGHGSSDAWTGWNTLGEYFDTGDVAALANLPARVPVLWSFACNNAELGVGDSIGEVWLEGAARAVAHYGATVPSGTLQNHELDRQMFKAVYDTGLTTHARAIERGEAQMAAISGASGNAWMYLLLGDPEMRIRRARPVHFLVRLAAAIPVCPDGGCTLDVAVEDEAGIPVEGVLVSLFKGTPGRGEEVQDNRYTDAAGKASIPAAPQTPGELLVTLRDLAGNGIIEAIPVR